MLYLKRIHFILIVTAAFGLMYAGNSEAETATLKPDQQVQLTLTQAIDLALQVNRGITTAANVVASSELSVQAAESEFEVRFVPAVDASASRSDADTDTVEDLNVAGAVEKKFTLGPTGSIVPRVSKSDTGEYTSGIGVLLDIPLFSGFGREVNLDGVDTAGFNLRESRYADYLTRDRTVLDTVSAVYAVIEQEELLKLFRGQVARYEGYADAARVKEKAGLASPIDVYRAEISRQNAEDRLSRTQKALADAADRLKLILTLPLDIDVRVTAPLAYDPVQLSPQEALEIALDNRVELKRAEDRVDEALRKSRIAKQDILPDVSLLLDYERAGTAEEFRDSVELDENNWRVALFGRTSFPRTFEKAAFQQSLIRIRNARLGLAQERDDIEREVRAQLVALKESENSIKIRREQISTAEGKLALSQIKFRYGMANNFDVIESENELEGAKVDLLSAETDYIVGIYRLRSVLGTLTQ